MLGNPSKRRCKYGTIYDSPLLLMLVCYSSVRRQGEARSVPELNGHWKLLKQRLHFLGLEKTFSPLQVHRSLEGTYSFHFHGFKTKPSNQKVEGVTRGNPFCYDFFCGKKNAVLISETSVIFCHTTRFHIPEDSSSPLTTRMQQRHKRSLY